MPWWNVLAAGESVLATCLSIYQPYQFWTVLSNGTPWYSFLIIFIIFFWVLHLLWPKQLN